MTIHDQIYDMALRLSDNTKYSVLECYLILDDIYNNFGKKAIDLLYTLYNEGDDDLFVYKTDQFGYILLNAQQ